MKTQKWLIKKQKYLALLLLLYVILNFLGKYNIDIGFALKPYMIALPAILIFGNIKYLKRTLNFEKLLYLTYGLSVLSFFWSYDKVSSLRYIIGIVLFLLNYTSFKFLLSKISVKQIENILFYAGLLICSVSLILYLIGMYCLDFQFNIANTRMYGVMVDRATPRLVGLAKDPNIYCVYISVFIFFSLSKIRSSLKYKSLFFLSTLVLFLTFSRGGMLTLATIFLIMLFSKKENRIKGLVGVALLIISLITVNDILGLGVDKILISRFTSHRITSGRLDIWSHGLEMLKNNPFGVGIGAFRSLNIELFDDTHHMHNTIWQFFVEVGWLGGFLYCASWLSLLILVFRRVPHRGGKFIKYLLLFVLVTNLSLSLIIDEVITFYYALAMRFYYRES